MNSRFITDEQRAEIRRLSSLGMVDREIAEILGRSKESITDNRQRMGLTSGRDVRGTIPKNRAMIEGVRDLYAQGVATREVARRLGISRKYVNTITRENGLVSSHARAKMEKTPVTKPRKPRPEYTKPVFLLAEHNSPIILVGFSAIPAWAERYGDRVSLRP